jgi:uncharacterized YccA/Bax inhibitor family protein
MASDRPVTYVNVATKTIFLVLVAATTAVLAIMNLQNMSWPLLIGAMIVAFISAIIGTRNVKLAPIFGIIYAGCEGLVLGLVSVAYASFYEGIVPTALITTFIVLLVMMLLYSMNIIKVNQRFASFMVVALISIIFMSLVSLIFQSVFPYNGSLYFVVCILTTLLSAFYLFLDFENIKTCVESGTDSSVGWVLALGLMVSLVWIYVEILRLLVIFSNRRN